MDEILWRASRRRENPGDGYPAAFVMGDGVG